jgi:hypothetical protein
MVGVAALRRIQRLVDDYGSAPLDLRLRGQARQLSPEEQASVPPHARRVAGFAAMVKLQQLAREYRAGQEAARKTARTIAIFFAVLFALAALVLLVTPTVMHSLFRMLS